jgi:sec-independent protein translocase protein TatA
MLPKIGPVELILILVIVTMLFGVGKLPEVFGSVGRGIREFRRGASEADTPPAETPNPQIETTAATSAPVAPPVVTTNSEPVVMTDQTTPPAGA